MLRWAGWIIFGFAVFLREKEVWIWCFGFHWRFGFGKKWGARGFWLALLRFNQALWERIRSCWQMGTQGISGSADVGVEWVGGWEHMWWKRLIGSLVEVGFLFWGIGVGGVGQGGLSRFVGEQLWLGYPCLRLGLRLLSLHGLVRRIDGSELFALGRVLLWMSWYFVSKAQKSQFQVHFTDFLNPHHL